MTKEQTMKSIAALALAAGIGAGAATMAHGTGKAPAGFADLAQVTLHPAVCQKKIENHLPDGGLAEQPFKMVDDPGSTCVAILVAAEVDYGDHKLRKHVQKIVPLGPELAALGTFAAKTFNEGK